MDNKLIKVNQDMSRIEDLSELCLDRLCNSLHDALESQQHSFSDIWDVLSEGLDSLLWKHRMTNVEIKLYDNFTEFSYNELDHSDIQCGALTKVRQYIGSTNVMSTEKISFKDVGVVRHVLFGNPDDVCAVLYRQLDTSDIRPHRDILAVYIPHKYKSVGTVNVVKCDDNNREVVPETTDSISDTEMIETGRIGRFTRVYEE